MSGDWRETSGWLAPLAAYHALLALPRATPVDALRELMLAFGAPPSAWHGVADAALRALRGADEWRALPLAAAARRTPPHAVAQLHCASAALAAQVHIHSLALKHTLSHTLFVHVCTYQRSRSLTFEKCPLVASDDDSAALARFVFVFSFRLIYIIDQNFISSHSLET